MPSARFQGGSGVHARRTSWLPHWPHSASPPQKARRTREDHRAQDGAGRRDSEEGDRLAILHHPGLLRGAATQGRTLAQGPGPKARVFWSQRGAVVSPQSGAMFSTYLNPVPVLNLSLIHI